MVETLRQDQKGLGLDFRSYIQDLLTQRYRSLLQAQFDRKVRTNR